MESKLALRREVGARAVHHSFSRIRRASFFPPFTFTPLYQGGLHRNSTKCLLLDAPDNANTFLWLFRIRNQQTTVEKLDYEAISTEIERAKPETRRRNHT